MAYKKRRSVRKTSSYKKPAKRSYRPKRRSAAPREKRLVVTFVNAPPGTMVSTASLGSKSGRPVKRRY